MGVKPHYQYSLRYTIDPGFHERERMDTLLAFCEKARIDDVMLMMNSGELNRGHPDQSETARWLGLAQRVKEALAGLGVTLSLNPWVTLLHGDSGRRLREGQAFDLMVDVKGGQATCVACPLCESFQEYLADMYARYASIHPLAVWVEDDFRLHNHLPLEWGGCFCRRHMELYGEKAGRSLTREEFIEGVLRPGEPHPFRKIWLDTGRETMTRLAERIGQAVHQVSPSCSVGLMSSSPPVHCAEGRSWEGILSGLAGATPMLNRPNLPSYVENSSQRYLCDFNALSRMSRAFAPRDTKVLPELESYPFTRHSKSNSFMQFQVEASAVLGAAGITISLHDVMGNGNLAGEDYEPALSGIKPFLEQTAALGLSPFDQNGVVVLASPDASYTLQTSDGKRMEELYPRENAWSHLLTAYSVAHTFGTSPYIKGRVAAVSGQYFRSLSEAQIKALLADNFVLLEGEAADTLCRMGLGELLGISGAVWREQDRGHQTYEQVCDGKRYAGVDEARISAQVSAGDYLDIAYERQPSVKSVLKNPCGETVGAGWAAGPGFAILPYRIDGYGCQSHLNPIRQQLLTSVLREQTKAPCPSYAAGRPYIGVYEYAREGIPAFILLNAGRDDAAPLRLCSPSAVRVGEWMELTRERPAPHAADVSREGDVLVLKAGLKSLEVKVLI